VSVFLPPGLLVRKNGTKRDIGVKLCINKRAMDFVEGKSSGLKKFANSGNNMKHLNAKVIGNRSNDKDGDDSNSDWVIGASGKMPKSPEHGSRSAEPRSCFHGGICCL
jgi:hypothetical protein